MLMTETRLRRLVRDILMNESEIRVMTQGQLLSRDILKEQQTFNLKAYKPRILKYINNALDGKPNRIGSTMTVMYDIITNGEGALARGESARLGFNKEFEVSWRRNIEAAVNINGDSVTGDTDVVWSHYNINSKKYKKASGSDLTLNFYVTVSRDRSSVENFSKNYSRLPDYLLPVSDRYATPIGAKTHTLLDLFLRHNDSLKVYYYDKLAKNDIEGAVKRWLLDSGISTTHRTHTHAVDIKSKGGSYGQILDRHIDTTFTELIKKHGNKFTDEQYYQWLADNWLTLMKQIKIQY